MKTSPNGNIQIPDEDYPIWEAYGFRCLMCESGWASCLHESPPKSLNPKWRERPLDRYPVCDFHHNLLHNVHWRTGKITLDERRNALFPDYQERITNGYAIINQRNED